MIRWAVDNSKLVDFLTFIPMRQVLFNKDEQIDSSKWVYEDDLCSQVQTVIPDIRYATYLRASWKIPGSNGFSHR
ncbi:MAG: hypothetical protein IPH77_10710 [Ignavibacteria bacterium]|nr:hypothetical protein [Ignavibacteria bacterium]